MDITIKPIYVWSDYNEQYVTGKKCLVGKWKVGSVHYSALISRGDPKNYQATCLLPGIKTDLGRYETELDAIWAVNEAIEHWFKNLDLD